jgi:hypothetical protein
LKEVFQGWPVEHLPGYICAPLPEVVFPKNHCRLKLGAREGD